MSGWASLLSSELVEELIAAGFSLSEDCDEFDPEDNSLAGEGTERWVLWRVDRGLEDMKTAVARDASRAVQYVASEEYTADQGTIQDAWAVLSHETYVGAVQEEIRSEVSRPRTVEESEASYEVLCQLALDRAEVFLVGFARTIRGEIHHLERRSDVAPVAPEGS